MADSLRKDGRAVADYDGIVVLEAESEEKIQELMQDKEYLEKLVPDEAEFTERSTFTVFPANILTIMDKKPKAS